MRYIAFILVVFAGLAATSTRPVETSDNLLDQLAAEDPLKRTEAGLRLIAQGAAARPAVMAATRSPNPEVRARAADILLRLPWELPTDSETVKTILQSYGSHAPYERRHDVMMLAGLKDREGRPALVRLLQEDPSEVIRWDIVARLHIGPPDQSLTPLLALDSEEQQSAAIVAGMALACRASDPERSMGLYQLASDKLASQPLADLHLVYGELLLDHGLRSLARRELETALKIPGPRPPLLDANAHFQLASVIGDSDDRLAADHIRQGLEAFGRIDGAGLTVQHARERSTGDDALNDLRAEMHWRLYRAAKKENKPGEASKNLDGLLSLNPRRADVVLEVVPALKEAKRVDDARALFARAYTPLKAAVDENPEDAEAANNLAWLCARCEEKLDEAEALSTKAVAKVPNNPAYLDTAAEAQFRLGRAEKAVELETKALQLRPGDEFMQQQLKRFEAGNRKE